MCGIAGYLNLAPADDGVLPRMVASLAHRGPDHQAIYRNGPYQAGMRRLSINDLGGGSQPLFDESREIALLYNGEIYNSPALRTELEKKGYRFRTRSDGEVICHLYHEHGEDLFERLDGMFAAALWISRERKLILARDLPGEKPLYFAHPGERQIVFGSEIRALKIFFDGKLTLNRQALWDFPTFLWIPEPATVYEEIQALLPGHMLVVSPDGVNIRAYRNLFNGEALPQSDPDVVAETRRVVEESINSRLLSDVPIGSFLSGGLDSSIVSAVAARELGTIDTFSIGFENLSDPYHGTTDESEAAGEHAARIGSRHHAIHVRAEDFRADLETFCNYGDQPFAVSSGLGILAIAKAARETGIKVLLSGDGADECFGGYSWYPHLAEVSHNGKWVPRDTVISFQNFGMSLADRLEALTDLPAPERAWAWHYYAHENEKAALFARDWQNDLESSVRLFAAFDPDPEWTPEAFIAQDRAMYFPQEMLRKVDRMTMAHSVEGRVPFAAPAVLAHAEKLCFGQMVRGETLKWALREAFADLLPDDVIHRPKHGFNVPIDHWLRNEWHDLVENAFAADSALARHGMIDRTARGVADGMLKDRNRLNGHTIFCFVMLDMWLARHAQ